jgi:predicted nucleotidyltransferase
MSWSAGWGERLHRRRARVSIGSAGPAADLGEQGSRAGQRFGSLADIQYHAIEPLKGLMSEPLFADPEALASLCRRYRIRRLSPFGSTLKGVAQPDSDVDLLVEFEPDARSSLLTMAEIEGALSSLRGGRTVDLRTAQDLSRYFREDVVSAAEQQYES